MHEERNTANHQSGSGLVIFRGLAELQAPSANKAEKSQLQRTGKDQYTSKIGSNADAQIMDAHQTSVLSRFEATGSSRRRPINNLKKIEGNLIVPPDSEVHPAPQDSQTQNIEHLPTKLPWIGSQRAETGNKIPIKPAPGRAWQGDVLSESKILDNLGKPMARKGLSRNETNSPAQEAQSKETWLLNSSVNSHMEIKKGLELTSNGLEPVDPQVSLFGLPPAKPKHELPLASYRKLADSWAATKIGLPSPILKGSHTQRDEYPAKRFLGSLSQGASRKNSLEMEEHLKFSRDVSTNAVLPGLSIHRATLSNDDNQGPNLNRSTLKERGTQPGLLQSLKGLSSGRTALNSGASGGTQVERALREAENAVDMAKKWLKYGSGSDPQQLADLLESNQRGERILQSLASARRGLILSSGVAKPQETLRPNSSGLPESYSLETLVLLRSKFDRDIIDSQTQINRLTSELSSLDQRLDPATTQELHISLINEQVNESQNKILVVEKKRAYLRSKLTDLEAQHKQKIQARAQHAQTDEAIKNLQHAKLLREILKENIQKLEHKTQQLQQELVGVDSAATELGEQARLLSAETKSETRSSYQSNFHESYVPRNLSAVSERSSQLLMLKSDELRQQVAQRQEAVRATRSKIKHAEEQILQQEDDLAQLKKQTSESMLELDRINKIAAVERQNLNRMLKEFNYSNSGTRSGSLVVAQSDHDASGELDLSNLQNLVAKTSSNSTTRTFRPSKVQDLKSSDSPIPAVSHSSRHQYLLAKHGMQSANHSPKYAYWKRKRPKSPLQLKVLDRDMEHLDLLNSRKDLQVFSFLKNKPEPPLQRVGSLLARAK